MSERDPATIQTKVENAHSLHRDFETRSKVDLNEVGAARYAATRRRSSLR